MVQKNSLGKVCTNNKLTEKAAVCRFLEAVKELEYSMNRLSRLGNYALLLSLASLPLWGEVNQNNDVQLWLTEAVHKELSPSCAMHLSNEWRVGDDISKLYFFYLQGMATFKINQGSELGPGYRQIWHLVKSQWRLTYEPFLDLLFHKKKGSLELSLRNRFSYLFREAEVDVFQYRGRVRATTSWKAGDRVFQVYLSNEIFLRSRFGFSQDRLAIGTVIPLLNHVDGDFYYMLRFLQRGDHWTHQHVFGTWVNFSF
jgi:hypothetical protein